MKSLVLLFTLCATLCADVPSWVREMATTTHPTYPPQTKTVVLLNEEKVTVDETGKQTTVSRFVVKVLTWEGKPRASRTLFFDAKDSKVRDLKAWIIQPSGKSRELGKKDFKEGSINSFELYSTYRYVSADASSEIDPGGIFGFEATLEEKTVFSQYSFSFQDTQPHLLSRFQLTVPAGWTAEAKGYQGASTQPQISGQTYTWEARRLGFIEREPAAPRLSSLVPRIRVSLFPPAGQTSSVLPTFATWKDVSQWTTQLTEASAEVTPAVEAKAKALVEGKTTPWERLQAISDYAQSIRYVAISTNISKGGGYVPHTADQVLRTAYGDCKDKANLMKALLKAVGMSSWMVVIYSGDPRFTKEDWPSPQQFNHAIIAVSLPESTQAPAAFTHPELGRLILFDPTDSMVPLGYLPDHEQDAFALLIAGGQGSLIKAPRTAPRQNHTDRQWTVTLQADGSVSGKFEEVSTGQEAFDAASAERQLSKDRLQKIIEFRMTHAIPGSELENVTHEYNAETKTYRLALDFKAPTFARIMKEKLWMVKSAPMGYYGVPNLSKSTREQMLILEPVSFTESISWTVPTSLKLDELPDEASLETDFGKFKSEWKATPGTIKVRRVLEIQPRILPPSDYKTARDFVLRFNGAESAPFVLMAQ